RLRRMKKQHEADFTVVNVENSASGFGVTPTIARAFLEQGVDVMTSGNHIWDKKEIIEYIVKENLLLRPANYPPGTPGAGSIVVKAGPHKVAVLNLMGRVCLPDLGCPFRKDDEEITRLRAETPIIVVDMHAEATSESQAMGWHLDGRVSAVDGTHRHVQTVVEYAPSRAARGRAPPAQGHRLHHRPGPDRSGRLGDRRGARAGAGALHQPDAQSLRARQGPSHAPGRGDPHRSRHRSRAVHRASARSSRRLTVPLLILSGKEGAAKVTGVVKADVAALRQKTGVQPTLAVILVGDDPASQIYV